MLPTSLRLFFLQGYSKEIRIDICIPIIYIHKSTRNWVNYQKISKQNIENVSKCVFNAK